MTTKPILMAVDGNSLLHRSFHALESTNLHDAFGRPSWAIKGMLNQLCAAVDRIQPSALVIGFDTPGSSVRRERYAEYKGTRSEKKPALVSQLELAQSMMRWAGFAVRAPEGLEADDVTATAATLAGQHGWDAVIVTSDRDAFAHISDHTKVLRIITGGVNNSPLLNDAALYTMNGIRAAQYLDYAALRGDPSDNLPGPKGIGPKTAVKLLETFGSMTAVWADLDDPDSDGAKVAAAAGRAAVTKLRAAGAREAWARNVDIMSAVTDLDLGIDLASRTGEGMLPLDPAKLTEACQVLNMAQSAQMLAASLGGQHMAASRHAPEDDSYAAAPDPDQGWLPPLDQMHEPDGHNDVPTDGPAAAAHHVGATAEGLHPAAAVQLI